MIAALTGALLLQWVVLIGLIVVVIALLRQVGMLHERLGPVGALTLPGGPQVGEQAPRFDLAAIDGRQVSLGGPSEASTLLFFLSPGCPVCKALVPALKSIAKEHGPAVRLVLASDGEPEAQQQMVAEHGLEKFPLVLSTALGLAHQVSKLPHAVLIDAAGQIVAKGLVNNREHLESLFEAQRHGVASLQEFRQRKVLAFGG